MLVGANDGGKTTSVLSERLTALDAAEAEVSGPYRRRAELESKIRP